MVQVGQGPYRVCYVGEEAEIADWIRAGFERADPTVEVVVEHTREGALDRVAAGQQRIAPRMQSPLADTEDAFDCVVCTDRDPFDAVTFVEHVREIHNDLPIVLFADDGDEALASRAISAGVTEYMTTDIDDPTRRLAERTLEICEDYREAKRAEYENERARRILDAHPDMVSVVRPGAAITYQNETVEEVLGDSVDATAGRLPYERVHPDDWQPVREAFYDAVIDPDSVLEAECRIEDTDGDWRTVAIRGRNRIEDSVVNGMILSVRDITERKERERDLGIFRRIVENAGDPIFLIDPEGAVEWVNDAFLEETGYDRPFLEGAHIATFMREGDYDAASDLISTLLEDDGRRHGRIEFVTETVDGDRRRFEATVSVLTDDEGTLRGTLCVLREVSA